MMKIHNNQWIAENESFKHPAVSVFDFDDLYFNLEQEVAQNNVHRVNNGPDNLVMYHYNDVVLQKKPVRWECHPISYLARGLILDVSKKTVVALPFPKFWNYGEFGFFDCPETEYQIFDKIDGSLGIVYHHNNQWNVTTKGSFLSKQGIWAQKFLANKNYNLDPNYTYLVEIIYPENNECLVCRYNKEALVFLSSYNNKTGEESLINPGFEIESARYINKSIDDIVKDCKENPDTCKEGYVIRWPNGYRLKFKTLRYLRSFRLISRTTPLGVWEILKNNECLESLIDDLPQDAKDKAIGYKTTLVNQYSSLVKDILFYHKSYANMDDRSLGQLLQSGVNEDKEAVAIPIPQHVKSCLFSVRKANGLINEKVSKSIWDSIRPTNNQLKGE